jgi:hydrogenase large subunit
MSRLVIDPVTRVGGQLRIEADVEGGAVSDAWSSGTVFRGMEAILKGRDARDAWLLAERVCGLCAGTHALASVRAVERALGLIVPTNARLLRDLLAGSQLVLDHVIHFYHLGTVDWVDTAAALKADPAATAAYLASAGQPGTAATVGAARDRIAASVAAGGTGSLSTTFAGHPAYQLRPEVGLAILVHYLDALDWQRRFIRLPTLIGGKEPHPQTFLVGGMAVAPVWGGPSRGGSGEHPPLTPEESPGALSDPGLAEMGDLIAGARTFVDQVLLPDVLALARAYPEWSKLGVGIGNYLSFGEFPIEDLADPDLFLPRGRVMDANPEAVEAVDEQGVAESVDHSWYAGGPGADDLVRPTVAGPEPEYDGPKPPYTTLEGSARYSWIKAPRFEGQPMEVGPLARMLVAVGQGQNEVRSALGTVVSSLRIGTDDLMSTLGRVIARAVEAKVVADRLAGWHDELVANLATGDLTVADVSLWDPASWPSKAEGWSLGESPRGAVGHWVSISGGRIDHYGIVDATTWNASPRDRIGWRGAIETALPGTPVADTTRPLEILRTVHSFDPCAACAVHRFDPAGATPVGITVREVAP